MGCSSSLIKPRDQVKQTTVDLSQLKELDPISADFISLSEHDKRYIKKTWKRLSQNMPHTGAKIFLFIFTKYPHVKQLFPCRDVTGDELLKNSSFRGHASRFMQAVGAAVDNIDDLDTAMAPLLFGLGQQHIHYEGFEMDYFDAFVEAIMVVFGEELGHRFTPSAAKAWLHIFKFIQQTLKDGYQDAKRNQSQSKT